MDNQEFFFFGQIYLKKKKLKNKKSRNEWREKGNTRKIKQTEMTQFN